MFLIANKVMVIQEETCDKDIDNNMKEIIVPYKEIVNKSIYYLKNPEERKEVVNNVYNNVINILNFNSFELKLLD